MTSPDSGQARLVARGRIVSDGEAIDDGVVALEGDRIAYAGAAADFDAAAFDGDALPLPEDAVLLPGLVDIHCHGAAGADFPSADEEGSRRAIDFLHRAGTTSLLASLVTAAPEDLLRGVRLFARLDGEGLVEGIHLEGPFLSHARCGAQNPAFLLEPDLALAEELIEAAEGNLETMTYAPELPGAAELVDLLTAHGVTPSLGHTDCDDATAAASLEQALDELIEGGFDGQASVPTVTHLFNGMPSLHHRAPGPVAACLRAAAAGRAVVELVADGVHLDPATVRTVFALVGDSNIALVTDSMAAAGLSDGHYMLGPSPVTVRNGVATLDATGSIAGGTATLLDVVRRTADAGIPLASAVKSATAVPAAVLGRSDEFGSLRRGLRADLVATDSRLGLVAVVRDGRLLTAP
ncbi:amidohydrolase family protein [Sinomonas sp. JGH33]|uniref:Amidohydrolase family protein n=1 Tax=Sinomonas terricola TaxID=3110330 RepID=A0ABU5TAG2_9MICC|nr:amidohydrolase family protein [Sinomonas sp. JGH33]MEA5456111.1 amidohydrolase family protein [Sinomonas sp. JGH33]